LPGPNLDDLVAAREDVLPIAPTNALGAHWVRRTFLGDAVRESLTAVAMVGLLLLAASVARLAGTYILVYAIGPVLAWVSFRNWRLGLLAAIVYLEIGSWVQLWLFPATLPFFFKDLFFIYPAMAGFLFTKSDGIGVRVFPWLPAGVFAGIVLVECLNPKISAPLIPLLGVKIWLGYVPLFFLGAELFRSRNALRVWLWTVLFATLPAGIYGLYEFQVAQRGGLSEGIRPGEFAGGYVAPDFESGYFRLSSLFPSSTQFDYHLFFSLFVGAALLILERRRWWRGMAIGLLVLVAIDVGLTGTRKLYLIVPSALVWFLLLERNRARRVKGLLVAAFAGLIAAVVLGAALALRVHTIGDIYDNRIEFAQTSFSDALRLAPLGLGSGMASGPARHLDPEGLFVETLPAKTVFELGILGLCALVLFYGSVAIRGFRSAKHCREQDLRSVALLFAIYLATLMLTSAYGWPMDLDPANVTSWLSAGFVVGMPMVASRAAAAQTGALRPARPPSA
jgi:hypothetical protein